MLKYVQIYRSLKNDIIRGRFKPDDKLPSIMKLMAEFKAAGCTVQHAINMLEKEGLIQGVPSQGLFVRGMAEPALYGGRTRKKELNKIGVLLKRPSLLVISEARYIRDMVHGIGEVLYLAGKHGYAIDILHKSTQDVIREINGLSLDGLICIEMEDESLVRSLKQMKLPIVHCELVDFKSRDPMVLADHFHGGELTVQKLVELGHKRILFIHGHKKNEQAVDLTNMLRWQGIQKSAKKAGVIARQVFIPMDSGQPAVVKALVQKALQMHSGYTGIICNGYLVDMTRNESGAWSVGKDRSIDYVVFDVPDSPQIMDDKRVWFCQWDAKEMGKIATQLLLGTATPGPRMRFLPMRIQDT